MIKLMDWTVFPHQLCSKFPLVSWPRIQSLRRSLRPLTFSKGSLTTQQLQEQLQRTSLRISYGKTALAQHWGYVMILICKPWENQKPWLTPGGRLTWGEGWRSRPTTGDWGCGALQPGMKRRFLTQENASCRSREQRRNKRPWQRKIISSATCCQGEASRLGGVWKDVRSP